MNKKEISNGIQIAISSLVAICISAIAMVFGLRNAYGETQEYYDIVAREVATYNTNKSGELSVVWGSLFLGLAVALFLMFLFRKKYEKKDVCKKENLFFLISAALGISNILFVIFDTINYNLLILFVLCVILSLLYEWMLRKQVTDTQIIEKLCIMCISIYYAEIAICTVLKISGFSIDIFNKYLYILLIIVVVGVVCKTIKEKTTKTIELITIMSQVFVPFMLCAGMVTTYHYKESTLKIDLPNRYLLIMVAIIGMMLIGVIFYVYKYAKNAEPLSYKKLIFPTTIMSIVTFRMLPDAGYVYSSDFWHTGEELLPWQQLVECGLVPYKDYNSESGLYPMFFGFIHEVVLDGTLMEYNFSWFLQYLLVGLAFGWILYKFTGSNIALFIALFVGAYDYNRTLLLIPSVLLICMFAKKRKPVEFVLIWITLCFLNGLYYPIYGVAFLAGTFPYGLYQVYHIIREKLYRSLSVRAKIYAVGLGGIIIASIPMLLRMAKNILELSNQTHLADGINAIYPIMVPSNFLVLLQGHEFARNLLYVVYEFTTPILVLIVFWCLLAIYLKGEKALTEKLTSPAFILLCLGAVGLPITYTFGFVRMDTGWFLARTSVVLIIFTGVILPTFLFKYGQEYLGIKARSILLGVTLFISFYMTGIPVGNELNEVKSLYYVSDEYIYVEESEEGKGFIKDLSSYILSKVKNVKSTVLRDDEKIFLLSGNQAMYYILGQASYTPDSAIYAMADGETQNRNIEVLKVNPPQLVQFDTLSVKEYYIYYWLMSNDYIYYDDGGVVFLIPSKRYEEVFGDVESARYKMINECNIEKFTSRNLEGICTAWGNSMDTLRDIYDTYSTVDAQNITDNGDCKEVIFSEKIYGMDADFIYVEMKEYISNENMKLRIYWANDQKDYDGETYFEMDVKNGKVLIPMGAAPSWLLSENTKIQFEFINANSTDIEIDKIEFLKLKCDRF